MLITIMFPKRFRSDADEKKGTEKPDSWITVNGSHIPIKDGKPMFDHPALSTSKTRTNSENSGKSIDNSSESDIIKQEKLRAVLKAKITNGEYAIKLNAKKQNNHTEKYFRTHGTKSYILDEFLKLPKSELDKICLNAIENGKVFTHGDAVRATFKYSKDVGVIVKNGEMRTCYLEIHFSKDGYHFVPTEGFPEKRTNNEK